MTSRDGLHRLVDTLPDAVVDEADRWLRALETDDPVIRAALQAPLDDQPDTPEDEAAVQEAREG